MTQYLEDDSGVGISVPTGVGTGTVLLSSTKIRVAWEFPENAPPPDHFDVIVYEGSDPNDEDTYLFPPISVEGDVRVWTKATSYSGNISELRAAVRAVYYKG
jgi:hypothetical protein